MSFQFAPHTLFESTEVDWQITATAWRGTMLEIFSRAERSVDDCIDTLETYDWDLGSDAHHQGASARIRALSRFLERENFTNHCNACAEMLEAWRALMGQRATIAHGAMTISEQGVTLRYSAHSVGKAKTNHSEAFTRLQMLELLKRLGDDQSRLHAQLGQIKAAARQ